MQQRLDVPQPALILVEPLVYQPGIVDDAGYKARLLAEFFQ